MIIHPARKEIIKSQVSSRLSKNNAWYYKKTRINSYNQDSSTSVINDHSWQMHPKVNILSNTKNYHRIIPLKVRSLVGLLPLIAVEILEDEVIDQLPGFKKRMNWFLQNRPDISQSISCMEIGICESSLHRRLLAIPSIEKLKRMLGYLLDEHEFLSPFGIRSLSRAHGESPYTFLSDGKEYRVEYTPGESNSPMFGGNSNWRGPVWFPINFLIIEALERYNHFFEDTLTVEFPTGSGNRLNLAAVARELSKRLIGIFLPDAKGARPCHGDNTLFRDDPHWRSHILFYEYFHGDNGRGLGASHQTGWTALVLKLIEDLRKNR